MAMQRLDALVQTAVESIGLTTPPAGVAGALYVVGAGATGAWAGKDNNIAHYVARAWAFYASFVGMRVWNKDTATAMVCTGSGWQIDQTGDMKKSVYDTDSDGKVNAAEAADTAPVNTFPIGDGTDATITIWANNADTNKPGIRYNATDNKWQYSNDGSAWAGMDSGGLAFKTIAVSGQSSVVADAPDDTLTLVAGSNVTITTDEATDTITIAASGGSGGLAFKTIAVSGQSDVVAESADDTLTLVAGSNVTITTNATTDTITISASGGSTGSVNLWQLLV